MKIGITGATGFVGRKLVSHFLDAGKEIRVLGIEKKSPFGNKVDFIHGDLTTGEGIDNFLVGVDCLVHLAARNLPPDSKMINDNVLATHNLIEKALKFPIKHIFFTSSVAVYGNNRGKKFREYDSIFPNTEYGLTKYLAERIIQYWGTVTGCPITVVRPFNMYGPGNHKGIIYEFCKNIKDKGKLVIYGSGKQSRDFLYIDDAIEIMSILIQKKVKGIFNIGRGETHSVLDVVKTFEWVMGKKIKVTFDAAESAKVFNINYSLSAIQKSMKWKAKTSLSEGIRRTLEWYEDNFK